MEISKRPILKTTKSRLDKYLDTVRLMLLVCMLAIPFHYFSMMPDSIPIHFNSSGKVDSYGSKYFIWLLPMLSILLHFLFKWLIKSPHLLNYPQKITQENALRQYTLASRFLRIIDLFILLLFLYITYTICLLAIGQEKMASIAYVFVFIGLLFVSILFYLYQSKKTK